MRPTDRNIFEITEETSSEAHPIAVANLGDGLPAADFESSGSLTADRLSPAGARKRNVRAFDRQGRKKILVAAVLVAGVPALGVTILSSTGGERSRSRAQVGSERPAANRQRARGGRAMPAAASRPRGSAHVVRSHRSASGPRQSGPHSARSLPTREPRSHVRPGPSPTPLTWRVASIAPAADAASEFSFER